MTPEIIFIAGTRPELIKIGPVVAECRQLGLSVDVLLTGQHTTLLRGTPVENDLKNAKSLNLASDGNIDDWIDTAILALHVPLEGQFLD